MKKTTLLGMLAAGVFAIVPVFAQTGAQQGGQQAGQQGGQQQPGQMQRGSFAQEQVEGRITNVDKEKGTVTIQTERHGQLDFKLTPAQVQRLNEGDQLRLQIQLQYIPKQQGGGQQEGGR